MSNRKNSSQRNDKRHTAELMLRNVSSGKWVARIEKDVLLSSNKIPQSLIQITKNEIYYTDPGFIIEKILAARNKEKLQNLQGCYNTIMDSLENYKTYDSGIEKVFDYCEKNSNEFDNEIREISQFFKFYEFKKNILQHWQIQNNPQEIQRLIDEFLAPFSAYVKVLFAYIHSALIIHKHKVKDEKVILGKICNLQAYTQVIFEKTVMPAARAGYESFDDSIYLSLIFDSEFDGEVLTNFFQHDRRFRTIPDLVRAAAKSAMAMKGEFNSIKVNGEFNKLSQQSLAFMLAKSILELLSDIKNLKSIHLELTSVDSNEVLQDYQIMTSPK